MQGLLKVAAVAIVAAGVLAGCAMPTEEVRVIDNRPQISFRATSGASSDDAAVFVDGLAVGRADDYRDGQAALRVLPGAHIIEIRRADGSISTQKIFVNDGVAKTILY